MKNKNLIFVVAGQYGRVAKEAAECLQFFEKIV